MPLQSPLTAQGQAAIASTGALGAKYQDRLQRDRKMQQDAMESHRDHLESTRQWNDAMGLKREMWMNEEDKDERERLRKEADRVFQLQLMQKQQALSRTRAGQNHQGLSPDGVRSMLELNSRYNQNWTMQRGNQNTAANISLQGVDATAADNAARIMSMGPMASMDTIAATRDSQANIYQNMVFSSLGIPRHLVPATMNMYFGDSSNPSANAFTQSMAKSLQGGNPNGVMQGQLAALASLGSVRDSYTRGGIDDPLHPRVPDDGSYKNPAINNQGWWFDNINRWRGGPTTLGSDRSLFHAQQWNRALTGDIGGVLDENWEIFQAAGVTDAGFLGNLGANLGITPVGAEDRDLPSSMSIVPEGMLMMDYVRSNASSGLANMIVQGFVGDVTGDLNPAVGMQNLETDMLQAFIHSTSQPGARAMPLTSDEKKFLKQGAGVLFSNAVNAWEVDTPEAWEAVMDQVEGWMQSRPENKQLASVFLSFAHDNLKALQEMYLSETGGLTGLNVGIEREDGTTEPTTFQKSRAASIGTLEDYGGDPRKMAAAIDEARAEDLKMLGGADAQIGAFMGEITSRLGDKVMTQEKITDAFTAMAGIGVSLEMNWDEFTMDPTEENAYRVMGDAIGASVERLLDFSLEGSFDDAKVKQFEKLLTDDDGHLLSGEAIMRKVKEIADAQLSGDMTPNLREWTQNPLARAIVMGVQPLWNQLQQQTMYGELGDVLKNENTQWLEHEDDADKAQDDIDSLFEEEIRRLQGGSR